MSNIVMFPPNPNIVPVLEVAPSEPMTRFAQAGRQLAIAVQQLEGIAEAWAHPPPERLIIEGTRIAAEALGIDYLSDDRHAVIGELINRTLRLQDAINIWIRSVCGPQQDEFTEG